MRLRGDIHFIVQVNEFIPTGKLFFVNGYLLTRHFSEYALWVSAARWHPEGERCPTWTDDECRCMLGGEA